MIPNSEAADRRVVFLLLLPLLCCVICGFAFLKDPDFPGKPLFSLSELMRTSILGVIVFGLPSYVGALLFYLSYRVLLRRNDWTGFLAFGLWGFLCAVTVTIAFGALVSANGRIEGFFGVVKETPFSGSLGLGAGLLTRLIAFGFRSQLCQMNCLLKLVRQMRQ